MFKNTFQGTVKNLTKLIHTPDLEPRMASMLLCVALCASGNAKGIPTIANTYLEKVNSVQEKVDWIEYARHGMVKSSILCGIPRGISAQMELYSSLPTEYQSLLRKKPIVSNKVDFDWVWKRRGEELFDRVYADNSVKSQNLIKSANPDLWQFIEVAYGLIAADKTYFTDKETELQVVVSLIQLDALPQLRDHIRGAENVGATLKQIKAAEYISHQVKHALGK